MYGNLYDEFQPTMVGRGGSKLNDLKAEFSTQPFDRGMVGMARSQDPNSANSQFFIMLEDGHFLNGKYTVFGKVISGMDIVDGIKKGNKENNGMISKNPDFMKQVTIISGD
jgi:cyclophilin family peptidyl-prolyl cis-trans isomerase